MGTPTPPPSVPGNVCPNCDGVLWPAGATPKFVKLELTGLEKCPASPTDAPNGIWWLEQTAPNSCIWEYRDGLYYMTLLLSADSSVLLVTTPEVPPDWFFFTDTADPCEENFTNEFENCGGQTAAIRGSGIVYWPGP